MQQNQSPCFFTAEIVENAEEFKIFNFAK